MWFYYYVCILVRLVFVILGILKNEEMIKTRERLLLSTRKLKMLFPPPQAKHCTICLLSTWGHKRFLSSSVFITRRWLLNLQNGSLGSYPGPPSTSIIWHVKTSCLGGGEDRCEEGMCSHIGLALSPGCLLGGSAEGHLHNRMIHHVGLTHLSHV